MSKTAKYSFLLLLTAAIWGFAFVAQYAGGDAVTGAATVILAMGAGKKAAAAILEDHPEQ